MEPTGSLPHDEPPQDDMDPTLSFLDDTWPDDLSYISLKAFDMTLFRYASEDQVVGAEVVEPEAEEEKVHMKKETFHTSKQKRIIKKKNSIIKSDYDKEISIETVVNKSEPYHIRQKQELKYLREKVQALQNELKQLEKKKKEEKNKKHILTTISTTSESVSSSKSTEERDADLIWKRVAKQQSLEKHKSLIENTRLKKMVQDQIKVAKSLERIIRKRSHLSILETFPKSNKAKKNRLYFETTTNIQEELFQNIDRVYANFDTLYQKSSVYPIQKDWKNSQIFVKEQLEENINTVYLESSEVRCFPFSFESTVNCFWNLIAGLSELSFVEGMQRSTDLTDDTIVAISELPLPSGSFQLTLRATMAMKRFVEKDRIILIYESRDTCESRSHKDKFDIVEVGWFIFHSLAECEDASILHSCVHFTPTLADTFAISSADDNNTTTTAGSHLVLTDRRESQEVGILTEMMLGLYQKTSSSLFSTLEDILLEEMLQKQQ